MDLLVTSLIIQFTISTAEIFSKDSPLQHFAIFNDVMYLTTNHTIGSPCHIPIDACADLCLNNSKFIAINRHITDYAVKDVREVFQHIKQGGIGLTRNGDSELCTGFEYIISTGYCILLKNAAAIDDQGYHALKKAPGTTYFELSKAVQDLFMVKNHVVLDGQDNYNKVIYNTSNDGCVNECVTAPNLSCNSFVFSRSLHVCALSSNIVNKNNQLKTTQYYDFYQYSGVWPCNVTLPWQYKPRVIASQLYPYAHHVNSSCHSKIIAPPGMKIDIHVESFFTNRKSSVGNDGLYIFDGEEHAENVIVSFCHVSDNLHHASMTSSNRSINVKIVQVENIVITRILYGFSPMNCLSSPCLFNGKCVETVDSFECICPNGTSGKRCQLYIGNCYSKPCINGTCHPVEGTSGYQCTCLEGFTGVNCEYNINECFSSPCIDGWCEDLINDYICVCNDSYTGRHCGINISLAACSRHDCHFGACALNESGSYCQCFPGFTGISCDIDIDDCINSPCSHGTCVDHVNAYSCNCSSGYAGKKCDVLLGDPCHDNPCYNGYCSVMEEGFACVCENGYTGSRCEYEISSCLTDCRHGKCFNVLNLHSPQCICFRGFTGSHCETVINDCGSNECTVNNSAHNSSIHHIGYKTTGNTYKYTTSNRPLLRNLTTIVSAITDIVTRKQTRSIVTDTPTTIRQQVYTTHLPPDSVSTVPQHQQVNLSSKYPPTFIGNTASKPKTNGRLFSVLEYRSTISLEPTTGDVEANSKIKTSPAMNRISTQLTSTIDTELSTATKTSIIFPSRISNSISTLKASDIDYNVKYNRTHLQFVTPTSNLEKDTTGHANLSSVTVIPIKHEFNTDIPNARHELATNSSKFTVSTIHWLKSNSLKSTVSTRYRLETTTLRFANSLTLHNRVLDPTKDHTNTVSLNNSPLITNSLNLLSAFAPSLTKHGYTTATTITKDKSHSSGTNSPKLQTIEQVRATYLPRGTKLPASTSISGHPTIQNNHLNVSESKVNTIKDTTASYKQYNSESRKPATNRNTTSRKTLSSTITYFLKPNPTEHYNIKTTLSDKQIFTIKNIKKPVKTSIQVQATRKVTSPALFGPFISPLEKFSFTKAKHYSNQQHLSDESTTKQIDHSGSSVIVTECSNITDHTNIQVNNTPGVSTKDQTVSDVITVESVIIGALFVALILVTAAAVFILYQRHRSGTVYITSPHHSSGRHSTRVKDCYSERTMHSDIRPSEDSVTRCVSSKLYDAQLEVRSPLYNIPKRKVMTRASPNSSPSRSPVSSSGNYDDVGSPELVLPTKIRRLVPRIVSEGRNVVNVGRGDGVISLDSTLNAPRRSDECEKKNLSDRERRERRLSSTNPFYRRDDGTIELSLSSKYNSQTQDEFESLLQEILNEDEIIPVLHKGRRMSSFSISGTDDGKSEA